MTRTGRPQSGQTLTEALLSAWEQADGLSPTAQAWALLDADPGLDAGPLDRLSTGARNRRLLELRARLFGPQLSSVVECPQCGERLEFDLMVGELLPAGLDCPEPDTQAVHEAWDGDLHLTFRLPTLQEVSAASATGELEGARRHLRRTSLLRAEQAGVELNLQADALQVWALLDREMEALDPLANLELSLSCPDCGHHWAAPFDVAGYLWTEVRAWGEETLMDVHVLALAYGWPEADILALSPVRRQRYLDLLRG